MDINKTREEVDKERETLITRLEQIFAQREQLQSEEDQIMRQLSGLDQITEGLDFMSGSTGLPDLEPVGFTDRIRKILSETKEPLLPTQIRELLVAQGQTASSAKNLLINVHTVLSRIESEIKKVKIAGKIAYISKNPKIPALSRITKTTDLIHEITELQQRMNSLK